MSKQDEPKRDSDSIRPKTEQIDESIKGKSYNSRDETIANKRDWGGGQRDSSGGNKESTGTLSTGPKATDDGGGSNDE